MDIQKLLIPLTAGAAVIGIYVAFRKQPGQIAAVTPNPASSGVTGNFSGAGVVQPVNYNVPPVQLQPNPLIVLQNPTNPTPGTAGGTSPSGADRTNPFSPDGSPPPYLAFNFGPSHDLSKQSPGPKQPKKKGGCGCSDSCSSSCGQKNNFPDGSGDTPLSSSGARLVSNSDPNGWINDVLNNFGSYLDTLPSDNAIPNLGSYVQPAGLDGGAPLLTVGQGDGNASVPIRGVQRGGTVMHSNVQQSVAY